MNFLSAVSCHLTLVACTRTLYIYRPRVPTKAIVPLLRSPRGHCPAAHALQPLSPRRACLDDNVSLMGFHQAPPSTLTSIRLLQIGFKVRRLAAWNSLYVALASIVPLGAKLLIWPLKGPTEAAPGTPSKASPSGPLESEDWP